MPMDLRLVTDRLARNTRRGRKMKESDSCLKARCSPEPRRFGSKQAPGGSRFPRCTGRFQVRNLLAFPNPSHTVRSARLRVTVCSYTLRSAPTLADSRLTVLFYHHSETLTLMGVPHDIEALADDNFSLDIALRGRKVAIEVDGPSHFFANKPSEYMGADLLRGKILAVHGWKVRFFSSFFRLLGFPSSPYSTQ